LNSNLAHLICTREFANFIEELLIAFGASSVAMSQPNDKNPIYEPKIGETPLWKEIEISATFDKRIKKIDLQKLLNNIPYSKLRISTLPDIDWVRNYQEIHKPIRFGKKLWTVPSWTSRPKNKGEIHVQIDPGLAFGSGSHETTHLCMEYLDLNPPKNKLILDYGCGSGILGITSILMGCKRADFVDIDPQALESTRINLDRNNIKGDFVVNFPSKDFGNSYDFIYANILLNPLLLLKEKFFELLHINSKLVVSGIMVNQTEDLISAYENHFQVEGVNERNNWCLVEFSKKS